MEERTLTPEEVEVKRKSRIRLFALLLVIDLAVLGYIVYEVIALFAK
jgi:hypothetical protein